MSRPARTRPTTGAPGQAESQGTSRSTSATIPPNILRYLTAVARERSVDLRPQLARVGLDETVMGSAALRVSYRQGSSVIREALELTGDQHLGMAVGRSQNVTAWGILGFALLASDTLERAIAIGIEYQNLSGAMVTWAADREDEAFVLGVGLPDPALDPAVALFLVEEGLSSVVTLARLTVGESFSPRRVDLGFPRPEGPDPHADFFGCPIRYGTPTSRLVIGRQWARTAMPARDSVALASALELLDDQMGLRRPNQELLEVLEISIAQDLPLVPTFVEQARRHGVSERTLRRRLGVCGTTYDAVVDGVRRERVDQLLRRPEATLGEVARLSGFSDERALRRAVRRWHGTTPLVLRARLQNHQS